MQHYITYRRNGGEHTLTVGQGEGQQVWNLADLNRTQLAGVREMIVNDWCRRNRHRPMYEEARA